MPQYRDFLMPRRGAMSLIGAGAATLALGGCKTSAGHADAHKGQGENMDLTGGLPVEREHFYDAKPGPEVRDAANVWFEDDSGELGMRIGIEHVAEEWDSPELWLDIAFPDGRVISGREHGPGGPGGDPTVKRCGPLEYRCIEPFRHWKITFDPHKVRELTTQQLKDQDIPAHPPMREVAFEIDFYPAVPPLVSGTLTKEAREMMAGKQGTFISPRYEQLCKAHGWLSIDGERRELSGRINRIKRQGVRKFDGFWGHCWAAALFPSGKGFMFNTFPPLEGKPSFNEGYIFDGAGELIPAKAVETPWMRELLLSGEPVTIVLETEDGRRETITGVTYVNCRSVHDSGGAPILPPNWPIVQQAHATYTWNGEDTTGMLERSTFADQVKQ